MSAENYPEMQLISPKSFDYPARRSADNDDLTTPEPDPCADPARVVSVLLNDSDVPYISIKCGESVRLSMRDGTPIRNAHSIMPLSADDSIGVNQDGDWVYRAKPCDKCCLDYSVNILVEDACGSFSNAIINVDCGAASEDLQISGPTSAVAGSQYSANKSVTWSISCGSIDPTSGIVISVTGCCGSGKVTATDACGNIASKVVKFATGVWTVIYNCTYSPGGCAWGVCQIESNDGTYITLIETAYRCLVPLSLPCDSPCPAYCGAGNGALGLCNCNFVPGKLCIEQSRIFRWNCP